MTSRSRRPRSLPAIDDNFIEEGARVEAIAGRIVSVPPAKEPHARTHAGLGYVLTAHLSPGYASALDMLTRPSVGSNFAPDATVYPAARDRVTGGRQLEELAFEIADAQPLADARDKARELVARGVRRVFCIALKSRRVLEWSPATADWSPLRPDGAIDDRCFAIPLPLRALVDAAAADEAVVRALDARRHPAILAIEARGREEGRDEGRLAQARESLRAVLAARGLQPTRAQHALIDSADTATLARWLVSSATARTVADALAADPKSRLRGEPE